MKVTLWTGPISDAQVPACFVPGTIFPPSFGCQNPEPPPERQPPYGHVYNCQTAAERIRSGSRYLPGMLRSVGVNPAHVDGVYLASFSAGHNVIKDRVFMSPEDRAMVDTFYSCDSTYTGWVGDDPTKGPFPKPGYVQFMLDCLTQKKLFLASAGPSTPMGADGKPLPSSAQTMWGLAAEVERVTGLKFRDVDLGITVAPYHAKRLDGANGGSIILAEFPTVQHQNQPRLVAPAMWRQVLLPWLGIDPCGEPAGRSLAGAPDGCANRPPAPAEPWMQGDPSDPGFMDDVAVHERVKTTWRFEDYATLGVCAVAGFAAWQGVWPVLRQKLRR